MKSALYLLLPMLLLSTPLLLSAQIKKTSTKQTKKPADAQSFRLFNPDTMAKPTAGYSQVAEVNDGKIVYIAGQVALDPSGNLVGPNDLRAQIDQVFKNIKAAVEAAGGDMNSVIKLNYFCAESVDPAQTPAVREIRDRYVNTANPPTSTFVVVKRLVRPEWLIEVEAVAVVKK
jgi:enamine deaminase RidA (YjgF/YER057c/UK114 family)